jgi:excisionase family DNA binding protein
MSAPAAYSVRRAAVALDMSETTVRAMIERKKLRAIRIDTGSGRPTLRIPVTEINRVLEGGEGAMPRRADDGAADSGASDSGDGFVPYTGPIT